MTHTRSGINGLGTLCPARADGLERVERLAAVAHPQFAKRRTVQGVGIQSFCEGVRVNLDRPAFFPFLVGTTTKASRDHAIELWHLPHFMDDIDIKFNVGEHEITVSAAHGGSKILDMRITDYEWEPVEHYYQAFEHDATGTYMATMAMNAQFSENEEERGSIEIYPHEFTAGLDPDAVNSTPFRELWMKDGRQTFDPLETIGPGGHSG